MRLPKIKSTGPQDGQNGFAMIQVMVAMAILGILVVAFSGMISQTVKAQRIARVHGEKINLQAVFRGSLTCTTSCEDLKRDVPPMIGQWKVQPICEKKKLVINVAHSEIYGGNWSRLYKSGQENAVCKHFVPIGVNGTAQTNRRRVCPEGKKVRSVDFSTQKIECK